MERFTMVTSKCSEKQYIMFFIIAVTYTCVFMDHFRKSSVHYFIVCYNNFHSLIHTFICSFIHTIIHQYRHSFIH